MRQRITFLQQPQDAVDPKSVEVLKSSVSAKKIRAAREDRITFGFSELPQELYRVLKASHELHIRWISPDNFDTSLPLLSRLPPGLHTFYSPQRNSKAPDLLCPALKKVFGDIDCVSPEESFTKLSVERFASNAATQYYQPLEDLTDLVEYVKHKLCKPTEQECLSRVALLQEASSVDIDFDTISHALNIAAYWTPRTWNLDVANKGGKDRVEVGFLSPEEPLQPEELSLGGFLTVVGEDSKLSPTLFSFPARHHPSTTKYSSSFLSPTGLHPTLQLSINSVSPPVSDRSCSLHTYLTLPRTIFPDKYQLADPLFLASKNLSSIHHVSSPVDLEAPDYAMKIWGSSLLVELAPPRSSKSFTSEIPLHLRYLAPTYNTSGLTSIEIPYPVLFWACTADEGSKFTVNPFDRVNIGYDGLFGPKTMFYHATPQAGATGRLMNEVTVPVLDLEKSRWVERGTAGVVLLGFLWIIWCLCSRPQGNHSLKSRVWRKAGYGSGAKAPAAVMKKKQ